jgi:penicillin-binding protein 1A
MITWLTSPPAIAWLTVVCTLALLCAAIYSKKVSALVVGVGMTSLVGFYGLASIPLPRDIDLPSAAAVYDVNGRLIGTYGDVRRFIIDTSTLPPYVGEAVVSAEDRRFYEHGGVDYRGVLRAALADLTSGRIRQGGSTITQQYVKNALLRDPSHSLARKLRELVLAVKLEDRYSKGQILGFYLNTVYWGRGVYGIEAAARTYFDKHARDLTLAESAYLAGIIRAPESLQPDRDQADAIQRRNQVLRAMHDERYITLADAERAVALPIGASNGIDERARELRAAYLVEWLRRDVLIPAFGDCLYTCGLKIHTTIDLNMQRFAEQAVANTLTRADDPEAALVALTPQGEVRALVGGRRFHDSVAASGFNYAVDLPGRQAGSALKPFTLAAALQNGLTRYSLFSGASPTKVTAPACTQGSKPWRVQNYGGASYSEISLDSATTYSVNTIYAQVAALIGPEKIAESLAAFGFDRHGTRARRLLPPYCSLALGALDVTPIELARAYATLASRGFLPPITPIRYVEDSFGHCLRSFVKEVTECDRTTPPHVERIVAPVIADQVTAVLRNVVQHGTGTAAAVGFDPAGKTGTSQRNVDAWFAGYTRQLSAAVWVGYPAEKRGQLVPQMRSCPDRRLCRPFRGRDVTGGSVPARIWAAFMRKALAYLHTVPDSQLADANNEASPYDFVPSPAASTPWGGGSPPSSRPSRPSASPSPTPSPVIMLPSPLPTSS